MAGRSCPTRRRRVCRLHQVQLFLIHHSQHPKKRAWQQFCSVRCRRETFPAEIGTFKWPSERDRGGTKAGKIIPPLFQFRLCLSLSLLSGLPPVPSLPHTHLLANGIALYSRKFVRGDSFVRRARPDPTWWRRRTRARREENCGPGQRVEIRRGEVAAL